MTDSAGVSRRPLITPGQGVNIGLVIVLLGAAWQLGEKQADIRVLLAQTQGEIRALSTTVDGLRQDLRDLRAEVKGIKDERASR